VGSHLYWISGDTIVEANLNGTNAKTIAQGQNGPVAVAVAVGGGHLYWAIPGGYSNNDGAIVEANLNGTDVQTIAQGQPTPSGVAVTASHLYWSNGADDTIVEANLDGTNATTIVTVANVQLLGDLAAGSGHLYWGYYDSFDPYWTLVGARPDGTHARAIAANKALPQAVAVGP
jgi:hypothetical protein